MESLIERASIIWNPHGTKAVDPEQFVSPAAWPHKTGRVKGLVFTGRYRGVAFTIQRRPSGDPKFARCELLVTVRPLDWRPKTEFTVIEGADNRIPQAVDAAHDCIDLYFDEG